MGRGQNGIENREAEELICTAHVHELRRGGCWIVEWYRVGGNKGEKKREICNR